MIYKLDIWPIVYLIIVKFIYIMIISHRYMAHRYIMILQWAINELYNY